jgi:hypothetical protein
MKLKKLVLALTGIALSFTLFAGTSFAAWAACTPKQLGPYSSIVRLQVTNCNVNPAGAKNGWVTLKSDQEDQMMATILTAMSLGKAVAVEYGVEGTDSAGYNIVSGVILNN